MQVEGAVFRNGVRVEAVRDWPASPSTPQEQAELRGLLESCLGELPLPLRQALLLRDVDGLGADAVCEVLGVERANLHTMIHRAKLRLRALLETRLARDPRTGGTA